MLKQTLLAGIVSFTALASFINYRFINLPKSIGITIITFTFALMLMLLMRLNVHIVDPIVACLSGVDFSQTVLHGLISYILFASSLNINRVALKEFRWFILSLATLSVLISTLIIGIATWCVLQIFALPISIYYCLAFGALISPTDPIAVLATLKRINQTSSLKIKFAGEALFNDGIGIVLFLVFYELAITQEQSFSLIHALNFFIQGALGGILCGMILAYIGIWVLRSIKDVHEAFLFTFALVTAGYTLSDSVLHVSGVLAISTCGIIIGSKLNAILSGKRLKTAFQEIWEVIDELLNTILFVLIGLECLTINFNSSVLLACLAVIGITLGSRLMSLLIPACFIHKFRTQEQLQELWLLSWGD